MGLNNGPETHDVGVMRFRNNGTLDNDFGGGINEYDITGNQEIGTGIAVLDNGKMILSGSGGPMPRDFFVARILENGPLDLNFGDDSGRTVTPLGDNDSKADAMDIGTNGKIVVAGYAQRNVTEQDMAVVRYTSNGLLDETFSKDGIKIFSVGKHDDAALDVAIQPDGKIVLAGRARNDGNDTNFALARLTRRGKLDKTFSKDGKVISRLNKTEPDSAEALELTGNGKIVVAGNTYRESDFDFVTHRYRANGRLDKAFGKGGTKAFGFGAGSSSRAYGMAIDDAGRIVVGGATISGAFDMFAIARLKPGGNLDKSFGDSGKMSHPAGSEYAWIKDVVIMGNGKIGATGLAFTFAGAFSSDDFALARYLGN